VQLPFARGRWRYPAALIIVGIAIGASVGVWHTGATNTLYLLLVGVALAAWAGGRGAGMLSATIVVVTVVVFKVTGRELPEVDDLSIVLFVIVTPAVAYVTASLRDSLERAQDARHEAVESRIAAEITVAQLRSVESITDVALSMLQLRELLHELLGRVIDHLRTDTASVFLLTDDGTELREYTSAGVREQVDEHPLIPVGHGFAGRVAAERRPIAVEDLQGIEVVSSLMRQRMASIMGVPLIYRDQLVGVFTAATIERRRFTEDEVRLFGLVADRMARAIDHARLFDDMHQASDDLRAAVAERDEVITRNAEIQAQLTLLIEASGGLIDTLDIAAVLPRILDLSSELLSADAYAVWSMNADGSGWDIRASAGLSPEYVREFASIAVTPDTTRLPQPLAATDVTQHEGLTDRLEGYRREGVRSLIALPMQIAGKTMGSLTFYFRQAHEATAHELQLSGALANLAAAALHSGRLNEEERTARAEAEALNERLNFLGQASVLLHESLDYEVTLDKLAQLAVPRLADWCTVVVIDDGGTGRTLAVAHVDPEKVRYARDLETRFPTDPHAERGWPNVVRTRQPELIPEVSDELLDSMGLDEDLVAVVRELGLSSSLVVPLIARDRVVGALSLVTADLHPNLTEADIPFAMELGRRAALAIENARLYSQLQELFEEVQAASAVKDEFLGLVSHELRTPITSIYGNARVLIQYGDTLDVDDRREAIGDIERESDRLRRIIENLLLLARFDRTHVLETEPVRLERLVNDVADRFRRNHPARPVLVSLEDGVPLADAQPTYLELVLNNLITNADKYSPPQEPIEIDIRRSDDGIEVRVLDCGVGVLPAELTELFSPFYRSNRTRELASGMGIGLAVCKRIIEAQGSRIWAVPRPEGGSEFGFSLRMQPADV
jgi:K+-sensing histidine kinase KdpD